jgi:hypothetical protein
MQADKIFIVHDKGWICSNEGAFDIDSDVIRTPNGERTSVNRQKMFMINKCFAYGPDPAKDTEVECMCFLVTGNKLTFSGKIDFYTSGSCRLKVTSSTKNTGFEEIIKSIVSM